MEGLGGGRVGVKCHFFFSPIVLFVSSGGSGEGGGRWSIIAVVLIGGLTSGVLFISVKNRK